MLFVIADQGSLLITQGYHVDILVFLLVVKRVYDIMRGIGSKPVQHTADALIRLPRMAGQQALAQQNRRRRRRAAIPCTFPPELSEEEFERMAIRAAHRLKKKKASN